MDTLSRCVLDEALQKSYDPYLKCKDVVARLGGGGAWEGGEPGPNSTTTQTEVGLTRRETTLQILKLFLVTVRNFRYMVNCFFTCSPQVVHQELIYPYPLSNRDYVYFRRTLALVGETYVYVQRDVAPREVRQPLLILFTTNRR